MASRFYMLMILLLNVNAVNIHIDYLPSVSHLEREPSEVQALTPQTWDTNKYKVEVATLGVGLKQQLQPALKFKFEMLSDGPHNRERLERECDNWAFGHFMVYPWIRHHPPEALPEQPIPREVQQLIQMFTSQAAAPPQPITFRIYIAKFKHNGVMFPDVRFKFEAAKRLQHVSPYLEEIRQTKNAASPTPPASLFLVFDITFSFSFHRESQFRFIEDDGTDNFIHAVIIPSASMDYAEFQAALQAVNNANHIMKQHELTDQQKAELRQSFVTHEVELKKSSKKEEARLEYDDDYHYYNNDVDVTSPSSSWTLPPSSSSSFVWLLIILDMLLLGLFCICLVSIISFVSFMVCAVSVYFGKSNETRSEMDYPNDQV